MAISDLEDDDLLDYSFVDIRINGSVNKAFLLKRGSSPAPVEDALNLMQLTSQAATLFRQQDGLEQRRLLQTLAKAAAWQGGELRLEFEEPFEILRGSNRANHTKEMQITASGRDSEIWLPRGISNS